MSSFLFHNINSSVKEVDELLNPTGNLLLQSRSLKDKNFAVSYLKNSPLKGERIFENERWIILFSGDIIENVSVPFLEIITNIEKNKFENFSKFNGMFVVIAYDKKTELIYVIGDRRSQYPVFYFIDENNIILSSELSIFTRLIEKPDFNEKWLYDYLFFNFPIAETTFLKNVKRIPHASCLKINILTKENSQYKYAGNYKEYPTLIEDQEAFNFATDVFEKRIPAYFKGSDKVACAFTAGWDGRTNLAMAPNKQDITTYTYGTYNCSDIRNAREITSEIKINHKEIIFDDNFIKEIPELMFETLYLSSGLQGILRSSLFYVFKNLTSNGGNFPLTISGIHYDGLFRGHFGIPFIVSKYMVSNLSTGSRYIDKKYWSDIFNYSSDFDDYINCKLDYLENEFGKLNAAAHHICYFLYNTGPRYFDGELKISNLFTTVRVPAWDSEIVDLSLKIKNSSLSYSQMAGHPRGKRDEMILQAHIIKKFAPQLAKLRTRNTTPNIVLKGEAAFQLYQHYRRIINKIKKIIAPKGNFTPLEDWNLWLNKIHRKKIDEIIFTENSLIRNYINLQYLAKLKTDRDLLVIGKLVTTEIILRLINNKWKRFW